MLNIFQKSVPKPTIPNDVEISKVKQVINTQYFINAYHVNCLNFN